MIVHVIPTLVPYTGTFAVITNIFRHNITNLKRKENKFL
jgi:hypothetical protein